MECILVDVTRAHPGTEVAIIENLLEDVQRPFDQLLVLGMTRQLDVLTLRWPTLRGRAVGALAPNEEVGTLLRDPALLPNGTRKAYVFSFHRDVLASQFYFTQAHVGVDVSFQSLARFVPRQDRHEWPAQFMPIDEATAHLIHVLRSSVSGVRKTDLRPLLQTRDARFDKSAPGANTPGLMTMLVQHAVDRGEVIVAGEEPNPTIYKTPGERPPSSGPSGDIAREASSHDANASDPQDVRQPQRNSKSRAYIDILRQDGLGYQQVRPMLYDQFEEVIKERPGSALGEVIEAAMTRTREIWSTDNAGGKYPWKGLRECFERLLTAAPVALDEAGEVVRPTWGGAGRAVHSLATDWRQELDGELVIALVRGGAEVRHSDMPDLAGALMLNRDQEAREYVYSIIHHLLRRERLVDAAGVLSLQ